MTIKVATGLIWRLMFVYLTTLFGGAMFIFLNNIVIYNQTMDQLLTFNIPFVLLGCIMIALILTAISYWRLSPVLGNHRRLPTEAGKDVVFDRLMQFPIELFRGMFATSFIFILLFHTIQIQRSNEAINVMEIFLENVIWELGLTCILSFLLLSASRRLLRSHAAQLNVRSIRSNRKRHSAVRFIAISTLICFVIVFTPILKLMIKSGANPSLPEKFLLLGLIYSSFAIGIFSVYIMELRREFRILISRIHTLSDEPASVMHETIPLVSLNETGELTDALNALQLRMTSAYENVKKQMKLAYRVQHRLLPAVLPAIAGLELAVSCQQCREVGGDFYDLIPLGEKRYCAAIGDVSGKGLPAALLMSAMMTGLRTEAVRGGSAGDILTRLNRHVYQMTQGKHYATLGLALIDLSSDFIELDYASAGHLDPYLVRSGQVMSWQFSSFPLGMSPDEEYETSRQRVEPGDIFVLYTDGMIEQGQQSDSMLGFDWWEQQLRQLLPGRELGAQLAEIVELQASMDNGAPADDRTLLLIGWDGTHRMMDKGGEHVD